MPENSNNPPMPADPLALLRNIHWPEAPEGMIHIWAWLAVVVALAAIACLLVFWHQRRRLTAAALKELHREYESLLKSNIDHSQKLRFAEFCKQLMRRRARTAYQDARPEILTGQQWRDFLLRTGPGSPPPEALTDAAYRPDSNLAPEPVHQWVEDWLKRHRYAQ